MTLSAAIKARVVKAGPFKYKMGTSGCREKYPVFTTDFVGILVEAICQYLKQNFSVLGLQQRGIVLGGDPRLDNDQRIQLAIRICAAHGIRTRVVIGDVAPTPAISHFIRKFHSCGAIILTASHNPGGPNGDAGLKFNAENGGPALPSVSDAICALAA